MSTSSLAIFISLIKIIIMSLPEEFKQASTEFSNVLLQQHLLINKLKVSVDEGSNDPEVFQKQLSATLLAISQLITVINALNVALGTIGERVFSMKEK
jgi:hypothetical protein